MTATTQVRRDLGDLVVRVCVDGTEQRLPVTSLAHLDLTRLGPISKAPAWRGRDAYCGSWWLRSTRSSTQFASLGERDLLIREDYSNTIEQIWFRPFEVLDATHRQLVAPLYMVQRRDRTLEASIRSVQGLDELLVDSIQEFTGLRLVPSPPSSAPESMNLEWLAGYRFTRCDPDNETERALADVFKAPMGLGAGLRRLKRGASHRPDLVSCALNLMWRGVLASRTLRTSRLNMESEVYAPCNR